MGHGEQLSNSWKGQYINIVILAALLNCFPLPSPPHCLVYLSLVPHCCLSVLPFQFPQIFGVKLEQSAFKMIFLGPKFTTFWIITDYGNISLCVPISIAAFTDIRFLFSGSSVFSSLPATTDFSQYFTPRGRKIIVYEGSFLKSLYPCRDNS